MNSFTAEGKRVVSMCLFSDPFFVVDHVCEKQMTRGTNLVLCFGLYLFLWLNSVYSLRGFRDNFLLILTLRYCCCPCDRWWRDMVSAVDYCYKNVFPRNCLNVSKEDFLQNVNAEFKLKKNCVPATLKTLCNLIILTLYFQAPYARGKPF